MQMLILILAGLAVGGTVVLAILGGKRWLLEKFERDKAWMQVTALRFNPEPINAQTYTLWYYGGFLALLLLLLWMIPNIFIAVAFWVICLFVPKIYVEWAWKRRRMKIDAQLAVTISTMCNNIRAGLTLVQSIQRLSESAPDPIRCEFKVMSNQYAYGADLDAVIQNAKERLALPNFNLFATALLLNREMGGNVADTLSRISRSLDKMREMKLTVEAHTSEGRTNIKVLLLAPVVLLLTLSLADSKGVILLFTTSQGIAILLIAAALAGFGVYLAGRITKSEG